MTAGTYGQKQWYGIAGFLGGALLAAAAVAVWLVVGFGRRSGDAKLIIALGAAGLAALGMTFHVYGVRVTSDGLVVWDYWFWFVGGTRMVPAGEIESVVLGKAEETYTVTARLRGGGECGIPGKWKTLKDAQAIVDFCTTQYGASAGVEISDQKALEEAAAFAAAKRWRVRPTQRSRREGERLVFAGPDGETMGEVAVWRRALSTSRAEIADGPGDLAENSARWVLTDRLFGSGLRVSENGEARGELKASLGLGPCTYEWGDAAGVRWSAVLASEANTRTPFTLRFYRGLAGPAGSKKERERVAREQGEPVLVAVANGPAEEFTVDVADEAAWPWVRMALAAAWLKHRPTFSFKRA